MTTAISGRNPNDVFPRTVSMLRERGVLSNSRNGQCLEYPEAVSVTFTHPLERVLFHKTRRINPFLHFMEPLWLLSGRKDVAFLANIAPRFKEFSDDGETFAAAYGHRLRNPVDQIASAVERLKKDYTDRRVVLQIRTQEEMLYHGKDCACNTAAALRIRGGALHIHVFNRSNDAIWGGPAGGTNHPQFTVLLEYMAGLIGCKVGTYTVTTDSMHAYVNPQWDAVLTKPDERPDPYVSTPDYCLPYPMMGQPGLFQEDLHAYFWESRRDFKSRFFVDVFHPMLGAFESYKARDGNEYRWANTIGALDWRLAVQEWFNGISRLQQVRA